MKTIRLKVLIPILVLAFICIAYSGMEHCINEEPEEVKYTKF